MEVDMSMERVVGEIKRLHDSGESLNKKKIKQAYPQLMKNALFYFPSWEHAIQNVNTLS
jgi:hypothetical protein